MMLSRLGVVMLLFGATQRSLAKQGQSNVRVGPEKSNAALFYRDSEFVGFSSDGKYAYLINQVEFGDEDQCSSQYKTIVDLGSGVAVNYVPPDANGSPSTRHQPSQLWAKGGDCYGRRKELKIRPARDYVAFAASHPSVDCAVKRVSPDGQTQAEARILGRRAGGKWKDDLYSFGTGEGDGQVYDAVLELALSRGGTQVARTTSPLETVAHVWGNAQPCWSHDSQTVAWKLTIKSDWKRDPLHSELVLVRTASSRK